jgi:hypothetical protein
VGLQAYEDEHPHRYVVENGDACARYATIERRDGKWHAQLHQVPYDFDGMAALAMLNGRPDWAVALRTGNMAGA